MNTNHHHSTNTTHNAGFPPAAPQAPTSSRGGQDFPFDAVKFIREILVVGALALLALSAITPAKAEPACVRTEKGVA